MKKKKRVRGSRVRKKRDAFEEARRHKTEIAQRTEKS